MAADQDKVMTTKFNVKDYQWLSHVILFVMQLQRGLCTEATDQVMYLHCVKVRRRFLKGEWSCLMMRSRPELGFVYTFGA